MRGNPEGSDDRGTAPRSIPAYAGEPTSSPPQALSSQVYPRVCGGTGGMMRRRRRATGLSPRMRGNHRGFTGRRRRLGSIPAYAGEPCRRACGWSPGWVYPRVCGGTAFDLDDHLRGTGLSPRMRGNRDDPEQTLPPFGSIPAYAGEPGRGLAPALCHRVYPRVCGGTPPVVSMPPVITGLSPRMRGNLPQDGMPPVVPGSIPAYAGEPGKSARCRLLTEVYPRVCGGTLVAQPPVGVIQGLSPRMRGNLSRRRCSPARMGSIPAYAGEPDVRLRR